MDPDRGSSGLLDWGWGSLLGLSGEEPVTDNSAEGQNVPAVFTGLLSLHNSA